MKRRTLTLFALLTAAVLTVTARNVRSWDFTQWSAATVENLMADTDGWSDIEKAADTEPTELSAGNCFWEVTAQGTADGTTLTANGQPIAELEGLLYTNTRSRSLAIAVNYGDLTSTGTDFAPYHGPSYLWLGGKDQNYLVIPGVPAGAKIRIGVESHKVTSSRGVQLFLGHGNAGTELMDAEGSPVPTVTTYTDQEWVVPTDAADEANADGTYDVQIRNTNGCHIYYIEVDDGTPWTESYTDGSTTDGWKSSVDGRFTPVILEEDGNYFLSIVQTSRYNNGAVLTGSILSGETPAGRDFTLSFDLRLGNSSDQTPVTFEVKDADNADNIFSLTATGRTVSTWKVNGNASQVVTLPGSGLNNAEDGSAILGISWVTVSISRKGTMTFATLTNSSTGEEILPQTLVEASATGGVGNIVFTSKRYFANFAIDNITLRGWQKGDTPDASATTYTVRFVDESGNAIKDDVTASAPVGSEATASATQTEDFLLDGDKWLYTGGNTTITLVEDAAQNVITLIFRKAAVYSYSVVATDLSGNPLQTLSTGTAFELDAIKASYPNVISSQGMLYKKEATDKQFYTTVTLDSDGMTVNHQYIKTGISGVVYCTEGENIEGATVINTGNSEARSSNAASGYAAEADLLLTTLPAGQYTLHGVGYFPNGTTGTVAITNGTETLFAISDSRSNWTGSEEMITLDAETTLYLAKGNANGALDFLYIVEGEAVPTCFQADVNGRRMNFRIIDKEAKTVETYPCDEFPYGKAIELLEGETEHKSLYADYSIAIPATVVSPDDGETYSVVGIADKSFECIWWYGATVTIPEGVKYIGQRGFYNNFHRMITLPSTLSYIANDAFGKSWSLEVMKVGMTTPVSKAVAGTDGYGKANALLLVPYGTKEAYAAEPYWSLFASIEEYRPTGTVFTAQTEQDIDMQFRVVNEDDMTVETYAEPYEEGKTFVPAIDKYFSGELIVPAEIEGYRVVGIGGWSFRECKNITSASLPVGITYIDGSAFRMTTSLQSINIPEGVETIGEYAFNGSPMTTVILPSTLKKITGEKVFKNDNAKRVEGEFTVIANMTEPCPMDNGSMAYMSYYNLYVPEGSKEAYLADPLWSQFGKIREIGEVDETVADQVTVPDVTLTAGETVTQTVSIITEDTDYNAYQFNLYLPEGVTIDTDEDGDYRVKEKTGRTKITTQAGDGSALLGAYTFDKSNVLTTGPLMDIQLKANSSLAAGSYTARIERVICANSKSQAIHLPQTTFTVNVEKAAEPEVPAVIEADDVEGQTAGQITLPVMLNNPTDINAFYFDLTLPKGITVAENDGQIQAELVGVCAGGKMLLMAQKWNSSMGTTSNTNTWRFIATPLTGESISANAGHVMNITLSVDPNMAGGVYTARLNIVKLIEATDEADGSRAFRTMRAPAANGTASYTSFATITVKARKHGDVNGDFTVDVADIATVIDVMAGNVGSVSATSADVNGDGTVDVADIATIIDIMAANARRQSLMK